MPAKRKDRRSGNSERSNSVMKIDYGMMISQITGFVK